jgi:hypothetical protein
MRTTFRITATALAGVLLSAGLAACGGQACAATTVQASAVQATDGGDVLAKKRSKAKAKKHKGDDDCD